MLNKFNFGQNALLTMDRGFFDSAWITSLKKDRGIDICIPLKKNFELNVSFRQLGEKIHQKYDILAGGRPFFNSTP